jgi:hypothetical protein
MKPVTIVKVAILPLIIAAGGSARAADASPRCPSYDPLRQPFFGDLHVHTASSIDAFVFDVANTPRDAYEFARGGTVSMTPIDVDRNPTRTWKLRRPLDFTAVTDHSEGFGVTKVCTTPGTLAYDLPECQALRGVIPRRDLPNPNGLQFALHRAISQATLVLLIAQVGVVPPNVPTTCRLFPEQCDAGAVSIWQDAQDAAMQHDDPCHFTTFVGYEWTPMPGTANLHRNVIFRNDKVPGKAISYYDTVDYDARVLWKMLAEACLDAESGVPGCDVLTIPHNSNFSAGLMFPDPRDAKEAADRAVWEPLVEITQHKGASECRFDRMYGSGVDTTDELCAFEQETSITLLPNQYLPAPPPQAFSPRSFVRSVLKDGLRLEQRGFDDPDQPGAKLRINPFKLGVIGSTDTHNGTPGNTDEIDWPGHAGNQDDTESKRMSGAFTARGNPGGLAAVWAAENTRESIFDSLRRRETYGTSGTRPKVRFFGGWDLGAATSCGDPNLVQTGYDQGVPMGSDLPPNPPGKRPQFIAWAVKDEGVLDDSGSPVPGTGTRLQRIQIVKGWVGRGGTTQESVLNVAPRQADGSLRSDDSFDGGVNHQTCQAVEAGSGDLCTIWEDDDFDPARPAFYYARVLEDPTCRWSTYACRQLGVDPFADDCLRRALPGQNLLDCCAARLDPVVQERAWTSPIWYKPAS